MSCICVYKILVERDSGSRETSSAILGVAEVEKNTMFKAEFETRGIQIFENLPINLTFRHYILTYSILEKNIFKEKM